MGDTEFVDNRNLSTLFDDVWTIYLKCDKGTYSSTDANMHVSIVFIEINAIYIITLKKINS